MFSAFVAYFITFYCVNVDCVAFVLFWSFKIQKILIPSFLLQHHEDIGDIFQDQENMAAILVREHEESGDLMMVSLF